MNTIDNIHLSEWNITQFWKNTDSQYGMKIVYSDTNIKSRHKNSHIDILPLTWRIQEIERDKETEIK